MVHWISGLIGREATFRELGAQPIGKEPRAAFADGWAFVPLDNGNLAALVGLDRCAAAEGFEHLTPGLLDALRAWSVAGGIAYVETAYHGGVGDQGAVVANGGRVVFGPERAVHDAINAALAAFGVAAPPPGMDAFDALGLGRARLNEDFASSSGP